MSPDQIVIVGTTWTRAAASPGDLSDQLVARLGGDDPARRWRAGWISRSVTELAPLLDRPAQFAAAAESHMAARRPVTLADLAADRVALLAALDHLVGPLTADVVDAWERALRIFEAIWVELGLDPFTASVAGGGAPPDPIDAREAVASTAVPLGRSAPLTASAAGEGGSSWDPARR